MSCKNRSIVKSFIKTNKKSSAILSFVSSFMLVRRVFFPKMIAGKSMNCLIYILLLFLHRTIRERLAAACENSRRRKNKIYFE